MVAFCFKMYLFFICYCIIINDVDGQFWLSSSKVDCSVTPWSLWSSVNSAGQQTRIRRIMRHAQNGGKPCPPLKETRDVYSPWSPWSANFGFGQQSRVRHVIASLSNTVGSTLKSAPVVAGPLTGTGPPTGTYKLEDIRYTGNTPDVSETAKSLMNFFLRPSGQSLATPLKSLLFSTVSHRSQAPMVRDLVLILDSSGSIGTTSFGLAKEQLSKLIGLLCPAKPFDRIPGYPLQHNQASMVTYSTDVFTNFYFNTYNTTVSIQNAIQSAVYVGRLTHTDKAFDQARVLFQTGKGVRDDARAKREVLILTDGRSTSRTSALDAVKKLKPVADVYGLMIGTFSQAGMDELTEYVSYPKFEHLFSIKDFSQFKELIKALEAEKIKAGDKWCAPFTA